MDSEPTAEQVRVWRPLIELAAQIKQMQDVDPEQKVPA